MEKKSLINIVLICLMLAGSTLSAQETKTIIPPLYKYLQNNADSTIVMTYGQNPTYPLTHFILSKNSHFVTLYLYESPYDRRGKDAVPRNIRNFFQKRDIEINRLKADTNSYFNLKYINPIKAKELWEKTMYHRPWELTDDTIDGEGCPKDDGANGNTIYDGGSISLYLITNNNIKRLYFYAPEFYNKKCPKRKGRESILELERLFKLYFEKN